LPASASGLQLDWRISEFIAEEPNDDDKNTITTADNEDTSKALGLDLPDREAMVKKLKKKNNLHCIRTILFKHCMLLETTKKPPIFIRCYVLTNLP